MDGGEGISKEEDLYDFISEKIDSFIFKIWRI